MDYRRGNFSMRHIKKATNEPLYYIAWGGDTEWRDGKAPRVHIGVLSEGLTVTSGQPNFFSSTDLNEVLDKVDDIPIDGANELPDVGGTIHVGFWTLNGKMLYCIEEHTRSVLTYTNKSKRILIAPPPVEEEEVLP